MQNRYQKIEQKGKDQVYEPLPGQYENLLMITSALLKIHKNENKIDEKLAYIKYEQEK